MEFIIELLSNNISAAETHRKGTQMNNYINLNDQVTIQNNLWEKTDAFKSTELADVQSKYRIFRIRP